MPKGIDVEKGLRYITGSGLPLTPGMRRCRILGARELTGATEVSAGQEAEISKESRNNAQAPQKGPSPFVFSEDEIEKQERTELK